MRILGLDLGTRTLGLALSDQTETIATSYQTLHFQDQDYEDAIEQLKPIVQQENIQKLVLGLPKNMNNTVGPRGEETLLFKEKLEQTFPLKVELQDERLSTKEATYYMVEADMSRKKRKQKIDALAATIILQTYLDKQKG